MAAFLSRGLLRCVDVGAARRVCGGGCLFGFEVDKEASAVQNETGFQTLNTMNTYAATTVHEGGMRCLSSFTSGNAQFTTDVVAPLGGKGEMPCPADMLAGCVASCMLSMIAYTGHTKGIPTDGIRIRSAVKSDASGICELSFDITASAALDAKSRKILEAAAKACPVGNAIRPEVQKIITWNWA